MIEFVWLYTRRTEKLIKRIYSQLDSVPKDFEFEFKGADIYYSELTNQFYNGLFPFKITPEIMEAIRAAEDIIIYGAGTIGTTLKELLEDRGIGNIRFAVTKDENGEIDEIESLQDMADYAVVLIASKKYGEEMYQNAVRLGFRTFLLRVGDRR